MKTTLQPLPHPAFTVCIAAMDDASVDADEHQLEHAEDVDDWTVDELVRLCVSSSPMPIHNNPGFFIVFF